MKFLYLVEGKHDCKFVSITLNQKYLLDLSKIQCYFNEGSRDNKRLNESVMVKRFLSKCSPYTALIKSENGKKNLISLLKKICIPEAYSQEDLKLIVIFDHDEKNPVVEFREIFTVIKDAFQDLTFEPSHDTTHSDIGHSISYSIIKISGNRREELNRIHFFCFFDSLENVITRKFGEDTSIDEGIEKLCNCLKGVNFLPD